MSGGYDAKDYVEVVDADGNPMDGFAHPVPKQWIGTDLLPPGAKKKSGGRSSGGRSTQPAATSGEDNKTEPEGS